MGRRRSYMDVNRLRRVLRKIDPAITGGVQKDIVHVAEQIKRQAKANVARHRRAGDLEDSIDIKYSRDKFAAVIGPGIKGATIMRRKAGSEFATRRLDVRMRKSNWKDLFQFFKGYWLENGTKGRRHRGLVKRFFGRTGAIAPSPFMDPAARAVIPTAKHKVQMSVREALRKASSRGL